MNPMHPISFHDYLQREVRIARVQRDLAVSKFIRDTVRRIAFFFRKAA